MISGLNDIREDIRVLNYYSYKILPFLMYCWVRSTAQFSIIASHFSNIVNPLPQPKVWCTLSIYTRGRYSTSGIDRVTGILLHFHDSTRAGHCSLSTDAPIPSPLSKESRRNWIMDRSEFAVRRLWKLGAGLPLLSLFSKATVLLSPVLFLDSAA